MESLIDIKKKYNALLERYKRAETYFNNHTYVECATPLKNKDGSYKVQKDGNYIDTFSVFNDLVADLSKTKHDIEILLYRNMTQEEIWNGFKF